MSATLTKPQRQAARTRERQHHTGAAQRRNWLGSLAGWLWLAIVVIPIYWVLITSFKQQGSYYSSNPLAPPSDPTLDNYRFVIESDFVGYFVNSVVVTAGAVVPAVAFSFMAAYAIVRGWDSRFLRAVNGLFLMGLAIPLQATVIPIYLIIIRLHLYDSLLALILTQSPDQRTLPLALWTFQGQYSVNVPAVVAAVVLTTLPIVVMYAFGRRQLLSGLAAGFSR